ncbi:MAG: SdrD B-like domain-containing protein [Methylovulum sp.]|nr:SdrD B-like domain-containing protein [Methylovulum sp.]
MTSIFYLSSISKEYYSTQALIGYVKNLQQDNVTNTANVLGVSAAAIAGAMAEENNDYWHKQTLNDLSDDYALSGVDPSIVAAEALILGPVNALAISAWQVLFGTRTHDQWAADYAAVGGDTGYAPSLMDKILHPVYMDLGYGNFKMSTAIRLVQENASNTNLGLGIYTNNYAQLAEDLVNPDNGVTAKLYGLMIREADQWYRDHNAYVADWDTLPQEIKDALYVTYVNLGPTQMQTRFNETTFNGTYLYEPLPAVGTGGGTNHLYNAYDIANAIGVTDYAGSGSGANQLIFVSDAGSWLLIAKQDTDQGAAYREALIKLRPFAVEDGDYDNANGQLELYDPDTGQGSMTEGYLQDRTDMLAWKMLLRNAGELPDSTNTFYKTDWQGLPVYFEDQTSQLKIILGSEEGNRIIFGTTDGDVLQGGVKDDHLYGGGGGDTLAGNEGNDQLEGGEGDDTYIFYQGDGFDTILDTDGEGSIVYSEATLTGGKQLADNRVYQGTDANYAKHMYVFVTGDNDSGGDLLIDGVILIKDFNNNDLNLRFTAADPEQNPQTGRTINGDLQPVDTDITQSGIQLLYDDLDNIVVTDEAAAGREDTLNDSAGNDAINSGGGNDVINATRGGDDLIDASVGQDQVHESNVAAGNDVIYGGEGSDILAGGQGDDRLYADQLISVAAAIANGNSETGTGIKGEWLAGQSGDDTLAGGADNDALSGGSGDDLLIGGAGDDDILGDADWIAQDFSWTATWDGNTRIFEPVLGDRIPTGSGADIVYAGKGADNVWGAAGNDLVFGEDGDDHIEGEDGNDVLSGNAGKDILFGGKGEDRLFGNDDQDQLQGGGDNDSLDGGNDDDLLFGQAGDDLLLGNTGNDELQGGDDNDHLEGGIGDDLLVGEAGNDTLFGGVGNDELQGGEGKDTYIINKGDGNDIVADPDKDSILSFGAGINKEDITLMLGSLDLDLGNGDEVHIDGFNRNDVFNSSSVSTFSFADGSVLSLNELLARGFDLDGSNQNDTIFGTNTIDRITGQAGNDILLGGAGNDSVFGAAGMDHLQGDDGNDYLDGGDGDDLTTINGNTLFDGGLLGGAGDDTIYGGAGRDELDGGDGADTLDGDTENDFLFGEAGNDTLLGSAGNDELQGGGSDDSLDGGTEDDLVLGDSGNDTLLGSAGNDTLQGGEGDDSLDGSADNDLLFGETGNDTLLGSVGNDTLQGGVGDDSLDGGSENDLLFGEAGHDDLLGGAGLDRLYGNEDNDTLNGGADHDVLFGGTGDDSLSGGDGADELQGNEGDDTLDGDAGDDRLFGFDGNDLLSDAVGNNLLVGGDGNDTLDSGDGSDELDGEAGDDTVSAGGGNDYIYGGNGSDLLQGGAGGDIYFINPGNGIDTIIDTYEPVFNGISYGNLVIFGGGIQLSDLTLGLGSLLIRIGDNGDAVHIDGFDPDNPYAKPVINQFQFADGTVLSYEQLLDRGFDLTGTLNLDVIYGTALADRIDALADDDTVYGKEGNDNLSLGVGDDLGDGGAGDDVINGDEGGDTLLGQDGNDTLDGGNGSDSLYGQDGNDVLNGDADNDFIDGGAGGDRLSGDDGADTLLGQTGNDRLDGGVGADALQGGAGDDTYYVDETGDTVLENADAGRDSVISRISLGLTANVENLSLTGAADLDGNGNELDNEVLGNDGNNRLYGAAGNDTLHGESGADTLDGGSGADQLSGGVGNDVYVIDDSGDTISEFAGEGRDSVVASVAYTLADNVEDLMLTGIAELSGTGNSLDNVLAGNIADNDLFGLDGNDTLRGNAGNDTLDGGNGADTLQGGAGDDLYALLDDGDTVIENAGEGNDTVHSTLFAYTLGNHLENLVLVEGVAVNATGNDLANTLTGNTSDNLLDGGQDADVLRGGGGNDSYSVDNAGDQVVEAENDGYDDVQSTVSYALAAHIEALTLTGDASIDGTGNDLDNALVGNTVGNRLTGLDGNDSLTGGGGTDTLIGGFGDDHYWLDSTDVVVVEAADAGHDTVDAEADYALSAHVEDLVLSGWQPINGIGNALDNVLTGNAADNSLQGLSGNDTLAGGYGLDSLLGGSGDDVYVLYSAAAVIIEFAGEGVDRVQSTVSYILPEQVENLQLLGDFAQSSWLGYAEGTGNSLDNGIAGNDGDNLLSGLDGHDRIDGRAGNDQLFGGADDDSVDGGSGDDHLYGDDGDDSLFGGVDGWLIGDSSPASGYGGGYGGYLFLGNNDALDGGAGNDRLDGGSGNDVLFGGDGEDSLYGGDNGPLNTGNNDTLDGGAGLDTMAGGSGDDVYIVDGKTRLLIVPVFSACHVGSGDDDPGPTLDCTADVVIENPDAGYDLIYSSVSLSLPDNIEALYFTGTADVDVIGNADFNLILGNAGNNRIDGGLGADHMEGGLGDDVYVLDSLDDAIVEDADAGTDTVRSTVAAYSLGGNLENLDLVGSALTGYGNDSNNLVRGNAQANVIDAGDGNDTLTGAGGDDSLKGGMGNDTYVFSLGFGNDVAMDAGDIDEVRMNDQLTVNDITLTRLGDDVLLGLKAGRDQLVLSHWFSPEQRIEAIRFCDGTVVDSSAIERAVNNQAPVAIDDVATVREDVVVSITANALANDSDPDSGDSLSVINPGRYTGVYGVWILASNGDFTYTLNNDLAAIQSLGEGRRLIESMAYTLQDNDPIRPLTSSALLTVTIVGSNDAPTLEHPLADQVGQAGTLTSYQLPDNTFADIDEGDVLTLSAQLADGSPLPAWLSFDAATGLVSGTPDVVGALPIKVTATDTGGLSASDVFTVTVAGQDQAKLSRLGDKVWYDRNANGVQEAGEQGVAGVTVKLLAATGAVQAATTTDSLGNYVFDQLLPGTYTVHVIAPDGFNFTGKDRGGNDTLDSDVNPATGKTQAINLASGDNNLNYDAGLVIPAFKCLTFDFKGNTPTDGVDGNSRSYSVGGVSVNASAFSRDKITGDWSEAWLGSYSGGLGVTDSSEGNGGGNTHTVDNTGRDNYVLFEFSTTVVIDKAYLAYVLNDSDMKIWIGSFADPFNQHLNLNDAVLQQFGFTELNQSTLNTRRWADMNAQGVLGNTLIIAADTTDTAGDSFKIQQLKVCIPDAQGMQACVFDTGDAPGVGTSGFWKQWTVIWDGDQRNDYLCSSKAHFAKTDLIYSVTDPVTGGSAGKGILVGDWNGNGITDPSESTLFYTLDEARAIMSASDNNHDCRYLLGKQLVASWLNVIAGNSVSGIETDIDNAIEWLQNHTPNEGGFSNGDGNLTMNAAVFKVPPSSRDWHVISEPDPAHSGSYCGEAIKNVLDYYNTTGAGVAIDRDSVHIQGDLMTLLGLQAYQQAFHG